MAKSRFEYVKNFEEHDVCLLNCWIVCRVDGKNFHKLSDRHGFKKPNDDRALKLMNEAASFVVSQFPDICVSYGQSDEYSFVFTRKSKTYNRRKGKLASIVVSMFTSAYTFNWHKCFPDVPLQYPPAFDSRIVLYPTDKNLRDYLSWRQADCHINNLHNYCYWSLIHDGMTPQQANEALKGTDSKDKNELLFSKFSINYNDLPPLHRKGSVLSRTKKIGTADVDLKESVAIQHVDIIGETFWKNNPDIIK